MVEGVNLHNSGHGLALCHVFDMSFLGIVHIEASNGRNPESEIPQRYLSRRQSFIDDARMHLGRLLCVLFQYKGPTIHVSDWLIWLWHSKTLTNDSKKELVVSSDTYSSEWSSADDTMTRRFKNSKWVWSRNTIITNCRQARCTMRKSHTTITRHQEDKQSKATTKMIAKLDWTESNTQQNI